MMANIWRQIYRGLHKFVNTQKIFSLCTSAERPSCDAWQLASWPANFIPQLMAIISVQASDDIVVIF